MTHVTEQNMTYVTEENICYITYFMLYNIT